MKKNQFTMNYLEKMLILLAMASFALSIATYIIEDDSVSFFAADLTIGILLLFVAEILKDAICIKEKNVAVQLDDVPVDWKVKKERLTNDITFLTKERDNLQLENDDLHKERDLLLSRIEKMEDEIQSVNLQNDMTEKENITLSQKVECANLLPGNEENVKNINIVKEAKDAVAELDSELKRAKISIAINATNDNLIVKADPEKIRIMFRNIIDNSVKYMKREGQLTITISSIEDMIFIVIKDNGEGLPDNEVDKIFELNYQGSNRVSGNGLGLAQTKAIVDYYQGTIYAKSSVNTGMGIYIQIPAN